MTRWQQFSEICKKHLFTFVGIWIIIMVALYSYNNTASIVQETADKCNAHWRYQLTMTCPHLLNDDKRFFVDPNRTSLDGNFMVPNSE